MAIRALLRIPNAIWMTRLASIGTGWRRSRRAAEATTTISLERTAPGVPAAYLPLYTYLERRYASSAVLTFEQIEALLGFALPAPAYTEPAWWTGSALSAHSEAWTGPAPTATPNLMARIVTFERPA